MENRKDESRSLKCSEIKEERLAAVDEPCVKDLNDLVRQIREERKEASDSFKDELIPFFDPMDGGSQAECLFLFEAPGGQAVKSGFVSRNNDDRSAEKFFEMNEEVELDRKRTASWNVVPWALRDDGKNRTPTGVEGNEAAEKYLRRVLDIVNPKVIVLFGNSAHKAEEVINSWSSKVCLIKTNHPSPINLNTRKEMREKIKVSLRRAKTCISQPKE